MICKNCGATINSDDLFCPKCGTKLSESTVNAVNILPPTQGKQGIHGALNKVFSSPEFLVACIFASIAIVAQIFLFTYDDDLSYLRLWFVFPLLMVIFLWIIYSMGRSGRITSCRTSFSVLAVITRIQWILSWIVVALLFVLGLLMLMTTAQMESVDYENLEHTAEFAVKISKMVVTVSKMLLFCLLLGPLFNIVATMDYIMVVAWLIHNGQDFSAFQLSSLYNLGDYAFWSIILFAVLIAIINIFCTRNMRICILSIIDSLDSGKNYLEKLTSAASGLFVLAAMYGMLVIILEVSLEALLIFGGYAGFMIAMGLALRKLPYEAALWSTQTKPQANTAISTQAQSTYVCGECGYSEPYTTTCPVCGSTHKVRK